MSTQELLLEGELPADGSLEDGEGGEHPAKDIEDELSEDEVDPPVHHYANR